jgi:cellulose synthase/poly-beta-1,6-N-acetylglucosamine synthase-like glycosyltransferase
MKASIGIMAYNEEKNVGNLLKTLLNQKLNFVKEVIIVNDGSIDKTTDIVKKFTKYNKVKLINLKKRGGKVNAINQFLKVAKSEIIMLESADTIPHKNAIKELFKEFKNPKAGIVGSHILPLNKEKGFSNFFGPFIYKLHHKIALKTPKFGELIAFRNIIKQLPMTAVDEECIAMLIKEKGYKLKYCQKAIVYNKQPTNISEIIKQRRRIHAGHLSLKKQGYKASTSSIKNIASIIFEEINPKILHYVTLAILLETYTRVLGFLDYTRNKDHYIWDVAESTKKLDV